MELSKSDKNHVESGLIAATKRCCAFSQGKRCVNTATVYAAGPGVQGILYCKGPHEYER